MTATNRSPSVRPGPRGQRGVLAGQILDAARESFSTQGWGGTTITGVARLAQVDPALVYHYFDSKERLLDECTEPPAAWVDAVRSNWDASPQNLGAAIVRGMLRHAADPQFQPIFLAILLTASHVQATRQKLVRIITSVLMGPGDERLSGDERILRASLAASQVLGYMMMRYIWKIEPIASLDDDAVATALGPTVQRYLIGDDPSQ